MQGSADETEYLPDLGRGATVVSVSPNGKQKSSARSLRGGKHGWRLAIQTLKSGKDQAASFRLGVFSWASEQKGAAEGAAKSAYLQSIGA